VHGGSAEEQERKRSIAEVEASNDEAFDEVKKHSKVQEASLG